jgi:hypothetical protein
MPLPAPFTEFVPTLDAIVQDARLSATMGAKVLIRFVASLGEHPYRKWTAGSAMDRQGAPFRSRQRFCCRRSNS